MLKLSRVFFSSTTLHANILFIYRTGSAAGFPLVSTLRQQLACSTSMHTKINVSSDMRLHLSPVPPSLQGRFWNLFGHHSMPFHQLHGPQHWHTELKCWMIIQLIQTTRKHLVLLTPYVDPIRPQLICWIMPKFIIGISRIRQDPRQWQNGTRISSRWSNV